MKKIIRLTERDLTRLVRRVIKESENKLLYDTELCESILNGDCLQSEYKLIKWYDTHKDKDTLAWFFKNPDPRIKKHLDHINTSCDSDPEKLKESIRWWWFNLANMYCSSTDYNYGRYHRELDRDPKLSRGCQTIEMYREDLKKFPIRDGF